MKKSIKIAVLLLCLVGNIVGWAQQQSYYLLARGETFKKEKVIVRPREGLRSFLKLAQYDVTAYKFTYQTQLEGKVVKASGVIYIPETSAKKRSLVVWCHGTALIPSKIYLKNLRKNTAKNLAVLASCGYIVLMPDYIGYPQAPNTPHNIVHPYIIRDISATTVVDMVKTAKKAFAERKIAFTNAVDLMGYSQGGFVALATLRALEMNPQKPQIKVRGAFPAAGVYNLAKTFGSIVTVPTYKPAYYFGLLLGAYRKYYPKQVVLSNILHKKYFDLVEVYANGEIDQNQLMKTLGNAISTKDLFHERFIKNYSHTPTCAVFKENGFENWEPKAPIHFYHGTADVTVPYKESRAFFDQLKRKYPEAKLSFTALEGKNHNVALDAIVGFLEKYHPIKQKK